MCEKEEIVNKEVVKLGFQDIDTTDSVQKQENKEEKPIAIIKPKYQKSSFDDRQLPVIAYVNRDKPWYDIADNDTELNKNTKKINLPQSDRKSKRNLRNANKSAHLKTTGELTLVRRDRETKVAEKKSVVAVVQPIKMEKANEPKVSKSKNEKNNCNKSCAEQDKSDSILDKKQMPLEQKYLSGNSVLYFNPTAL